MGIFVRVCECVRSLCAVIQRTLIAHSSPSEIRKSSTNMPASMTHNSRTSRQSPMGILAAALPVLCLSALVVFVELRAPFIVPVAADYVDETEMDVKDMQAMWKEQGSNYYSLTLADFIKNFYGGATDGYKAEENFKKIRIERNIGGGRLERLGLATHVSDVPEAAAYNVFFDGFENITNSRFFWRESIVNGYNKGNYSIGGEILRGGAEHLNDHGLLLKDKGEKYAIYALLSHYDANHRFNYRLSVEPQHQFPQVYQFEVAFTEGLTCGAAQLKMFNNIVTGSPRWVDFAQKLEVTMKRPKMDAATSRSLKDDATHELWRYTTIDHDNNPLEHDMMPIDDKDNSEAPHEADRPPRTMHQYRMQNQVGSHSEAHIVFGPERCNGKENVAVHIKSYYRGTYGLESITHTLQKNISLPEHDNITHVYTLEINPTLEAYFVYVDTVLQASGHLDQDFKPPFKGPKMVPVAGYGKSSKPSDWNETESGPWEEPLEANPLYDEAKEKLIFGGLFKDVPKVINSAIALGFEMETGDPGILVDNVYFSVGSNATNALSYAKKSWRLKYVEQYKSSFPNSIPYFYWEPEPFLTSFIFATTRLLLPHNEFGADILVKYVMPLAQMSFNENPEVRQQAERYIVIASCAAATVLILLFISSFFVYDLICALPGYLWKKLFSSKKTTKMKAKDISAKEDDHGVNGGGDDDGRDGVVDASGAAGSAAPPPRRRLRTRRD